MLIRLCRRAFVVLHTRAVSADAAPTRWGRIGLPGRPTLAALLALTLLQALSAHAQPMPVLQRGYDANVSGANLNETTLNTSNVVPGSFGMVFTLSVNDNVYAQPLYVPALMINGTSHNVVFVATMSDTLYAFDADVGGAPLWTLNLATFENATPVPVAQFAYSGSTNIIGNDGILGTPVIDPSTNTMYLVALTEESGALVYRLHAVNIATGTPLTGSGVVISGSYSTMTFNPRNEWQRASLVLVGNNVVFGFGAFELESTGNLYSGWVMAYNKSTLQQTGIFATETVGNGGAGVWQSGRPPVVDSSGYVYVFTGNGYTTGYDGVDNFSESVLKLNPASGLSLVDWFTPSAWATLDSGDLDLASSGPLLIPGTSLLAGGGKAGVFYLLNTGGLRHETANDSGAVQELTISQMRGGPVYWNRSTANGGPLLYTWGVSDALKSFAFNGSTLATTPSATGTVTNQIYPGGILTLSANGSTTGTAVLWANVTTSGNAFNVVTPGALYAFDASNVATELWNSNLRAADSLGNFAKLVPPLVANGRVYVATASQQVVVYGLLPPAAAPTFNPAAGTYSSAQSVALASATPGASFYYTTNGTTPTTASTAYTGPIAVSATTTLQAIAIASGYSASAVSSATYTINSTGPTTTEVSLASSANVDAIVNNGSAVPAGGLDGDGYACSATLLGTSLAWNGNTYVFGSVGGADALSNTTVALPPGNYTTLSFLGTGVNGDQPNQVFTVNYSDGSSTSFTQSMSDWFTPQNYTGESQVLAMAYRLNSSGAEDNRTFYLYGYSFALNSAKTAVSLKLPANRDVVVLAIDVFGTPTTTNPPAATPTFSPAPGTYSAAQSVTLLDATAGASIYYTTNGTTPTVTPSELYSPTTPINVSSNTTIEAIAVASGYSNSAVASGTYVIGTPAATPTFSPAPGTYSAAQSVTLLDATAGASIYYTTNGTTPTVTPSELYSPTTPINVSANTTIEAIAVASGYSNSAVASGAYVISTSTSSATEVSLASSANVDAIVNNGSDVPAGGLDGDGYAYSATLLGTSLTWNGNAYAFGSPGAADAVDNTIITLPAGAYTTLSFLGTAVNGDQANQVFIVTYSDGTSTSFTQSMSDWFTPQSFTGESQVLAMPYRLNSSGAEDNRTFYLYGYSFALNSAKTVVSLTLPANRNVIVLAVDLSGATTPTAATPTFSPAPGTYSAAQSVTLLDATAGASIYYTTNGTTPTVTPSELYSPTTPINVSANTTIEAIAVASGYSNSAVASGTYVIGTPAATPTFSPAPGTYSAAQSVTLLDATAGASIYYTTNGTTPTVTPSELYSSTTPINVSSNTTIEAIAVASGYLNSALASGTYVISTSGSVTEVSLASSANVDAIVNNGSAVPAGGLDGDGYAYSATLLGTSLTWNGNAYAFGSPGAADAVSNTTVALPPANYATLSLLGTAVNGNRANQVFTVTYSDGTSTSFTQSMSDWFTPQSYTGESQVLAMAYRLNSSGGEDNRTFYLYGYSFALNSAKTAVSLKLPASRNVIVLAVDAQ